ncbi:hypothetical protein [Pseudorhodobacter sp.]|uniref:hypothetical protein n=1 Tax=Pseudorhodobacter sp. TaxID=1934400 RepID=UPI002649B341|nr:hypothetical protein [Pseudorhodobacter sp.]MDN5788149.1 hypothetical protein [Pseudorhodobacter sp.]
MKVTENRPERLVLSQGANRPLVMLGAFLCGYAGLALADWAGGRHIGAGFGLVAALVGFLVLRQWLRPAALTLNAKTGQAIWQGRGAGAKEHRAQSLTSLRGVELTQQVPSGSANAAQVIARFEQEDWVIATESRFDAAARKAVATTNDWIDARRGLASDRTD